jgi:hypothetical protein
MTVMHCLVAAAAAFALTANAQDKASAGSQTDVTGTWVMEVQGHQMALELEQKDTRVEGVLHAMGQRILLVGDYVERTLTLKGERPEDGFPSHGGGDAGPIVATMLDNGTLEGELSTNKGRTKWTGERFKKR